MGLRSFAVLLLFFFVLTLMFGTQRLREMGADLGAAVKNFRKGLENDEDKKP